MEDQKTVSPHEDIVTPLDAHIALALECDLSQVTVLHDHIKGIVRRKDQQLSSTPFHWAHVMARRKVELSFWVAVEEAYGEHLDVLDVIPF